jgi:predicted transcriptional regulator
MKLPGGYLSKREQQIMEEIYRRERVTANELVDVLPGGPSNSTVRTLLKLLEEKGHLKHEEVDGRFVYSASQSKSTAAQSALQGLVSTFFKGSVGDAVAALLDNESMQLSDSELNDLQALIDQARRDR